ncbi:MAG: zinc D-Ala-D-Ala dipeptidase [Pseudonocardiales bacterium]|nr:zinc D-Ala-D-Ala dipeptidase [Pseudonocardiales bacterium]
MVAFRWRMLGLFVVAASAGCTQAPAPDGAALSTPTPARASSSASTTASASTTPSRSAPPSSASATPARPAASRSAPSGAPRIPPISAEARAAGLLDIRAVVPDAIVDLRYATTDNFVGVRLYPADARCLVHQSMAAGLTAAADRLRRAGYLLVFWDCYRPHAVQVHMFQVVPDPNWVARPGPLATSHEAARSVDVTLAHAATGPGCPTAQRVQRHCLLDMGTGFDDFSARAHAFATYGVSPQAQSNRSRLRTAMSSGGITVYEGEWWHFDGPGAEVGRPHLDAPLS